MKAELQEDKNKVSSLKAELQEEKNKVSSLNSALQFALKGPAVTTGPRHAAITIQLFFRRAKQLQISWWDTPYLEELVASSVLD